MKRLFMMLAGAVLIVCAAKAQIVEQDEAALVYYSPKTEIVLDFTYTVDIQEKGIYSQYAESLLGATNAVTENKTVYTIQDVRIGTSTSADLTRPHKVSSESGFPLLLNINEKGLLTGYNAPCCESKEPHKPHKDCEKKAFEDRREAIPYPESVLKATTPLAQAHAVAKQIFHLRETRMYLINGEVEHVPADGKAMQHVMDELAKQEQQLTSLFLGTKSQQTLHKQIRLMPDKKVQILYFSKENGFTNSENVEAETISVTIDARKQQYSEPADPKKKAKSAGVAPLVYNLPGSGDVKVVHKGNVLAQRTLPIAQLGIDVPVDKSLFSGKTLPVIVFSEKTGNIVSISK